jgi:hypothetical protein
LQRENQHSIQAQDGRPRKRRPCCPPPTCIQWHYDRTEGQRRRFYAVWRARLVINLRAKRLLSIVTGKDDDEDPNDDELQPSVQCRQAHAAHIMTSALGIDPFLFVQGVNNDPAAILRILDTKYQGTDTSSVMSAVNEFTTKKYRPGQHMEMLSPSTKHLPCGWKRLITVSRNRCALSISSTRYLRSRPYLPFCRRSCHRQTYLDQGDDTDSARVSTKGVNNNGSERPECAMVANNGFTGTCYTCREVDHRISDHIVRGRHQSRHPMRRYGGHGGGHHADSRQRDHHVDHHQGHGAARQGGAGHEEDFRGSGRQGGEQHRVRFSNDGNHDWRHARATPAI